MIRFGPDGKLYVIMGDGLGAEFAGDLFVGAATTATAGGYLFRFRLDRQRTGFAFSDPRLDDGVADNTAKNDITESESLLVGRDFGIVTDIVTGPNGHVYAVSTNRGAVYEIMPAG